MCPPCDEFGVRPKASDDDGTILFPTFEIRGAETYRFGLGEVGGGT